MIHAEIIFGPQLGEDFFNVRGLVVAARFGELDDRFLIVERFHGVFFETEILLAGRCW